MTALRAGVVGLGTMGRHHARVLAAMPGVRLIGACDPAPQAARHAVAGLPVFPDLDQLLGLGLDICVVAAPTLAHADIGTRLAQAGVHALIEKPLGASAEEGRALADAFERAGLVGCVGHIERFNPVIRAMRDRIARGEIGAVLQVTTSRQGPYPRRIRDVGVILDLASHDIDLTRWITGSPYLKVSAVTNQVTGGSSHEDLAAVAGVLEDGTVVNHLVNWLSPVKERLVTVTGQLGCLRGDLLAPALRLHRHGLRSAPDDQAAGPVADNRGVACKLATHEPLRAELEGFVAAVHGRADHIVPMRAGVEVMDVTSAILSVPRVGVEVPHGGADIAPPSPERVVAVVPPRPGEDGAAHGAAFAHAEPPAASHGDLPVLVAGYVPALNSRRFF
ncbi:Gfo/Idh/MocA family oxidoreductase [Kitasatospora sp. NPDC085895]|uniref:Gfo/Idh/MocA family oxidoreductase n=1 Tax=Kitasatospora sp. NPDC085895 TaxID=3155057 RepID=UPI00344E24D5